MQKAARQRRRKTKAKAAFQPGQDTPWLIVDVCVCKCVNVCDSVNICVSVCALVVAVCHNQTNAQQ